MLLEHIQSTLPTLSAAITKLVEEKQAELDSYGDSSVGGGGYETTTTTGVSARRRRRWLPRVTGADRSDRRARKREAICARSWVKGRKRTFRFELKRPSAQGPSFSSSTTFLGGILSCRLSETTTGPHKSEAPRVVLLLHLPSRRRSQSVDSLTAFLKCAKRNEDTLEYLVRSLRYKNCVHGNQSQKIFPAGFEPTTAALLAPRSNQLS